jgi:hypothetical protein
VIWLVRRLTPDDKTVADFRKDNGPAIKKVCDQHRRRQAADRSDGCLRRVAARPPSRSGCTTIASRPKSENMLETAALRRGRLVKVARHPPSSRYHAAKTDPDLRVISDCAAAIVEHALAKS